MKYPAQASIKLKLVTVTLTVNASPAKNMKEEGEGSK